MAIATMNRIFVGGPRDRREETLRFLQTVGLLHLEPVRTLEGDWEKEVSAANSRLRRIVQTDQGLRRFEGRESRQEADCPEGDLAACAEELLAELQDLQNQHRSLERLASDLAPWGDFDPLAVRRLEEEGVTVQRWRLEKRDDVDLSKLVPAEVYMERVAGKPAVLFYTLSLTGPIDVPGAVSLGLPERPLSEIEKEMERLRQKEEGLCDRLAGLARRRDVLKTQAAAMESDIAYLTQMGQLYEDRELFGIQGWIPADDSAGLLQRIEREGLPLQVTLRDALPEEEPPVLLRNNWFVRRIEPLLKLYGNPRYREFDPSYFFAPFMVLFFGSCLSDAGYGLVFYLVAHWMGRKLGDRIEGLPLIVKLCKAFAVSTIVVGLLTGSVFGYNFENRSWILLDVSVGTGKPMLYFYLALGLGVIHLSLSYLLGMAKAIKRHEQLQKLGLLFVLWGGVTLVARNIWFGAPNDALQGPLFYIGWGILALGLLLTLLNATDHRNWGVRLGLGLWNVYGLTGLIGDLLSYARLFGLGIGTAAIAAVMNQLAAMVLNAAGPVIGIPLAVVVIICGHTFNLALSLLGSTVHSARLHFVEAFKSFFEGGGTEYKPFKIERGSL
jgi:V/A-type H+-transporting ATPase subunit I